jgi:hypothetical protein
LTKKIRHSLFLIGLLFILFNNRAIGQVIRDSAGQRIEVNTLSDQKIDSVLNKHSPKKAAIRSAIIPGWGQAYNKKYWKIPIVYAALGTSAYVFAYNLTWYKRYRFAYTTAVNDVVADYPKVHIKLQPFVLSPNGEGTLQYGRNEYRRYIDYSVVAFVLLWGLNVVDAAVDAHLKSFDVSPDLSFQIKPGYSELANTNGLSLVLAIK